MEFESRIKPKWLYALMYIMIALAGILAFIYPTQTVESHVEAGAYVWASFYFLGGVTSAIGVSTKRWAIEWIGSAPLAAACAVYALSLGARAITVPHNRGVIGFLALLFAAFMFRNLARFVELWRLSRMARRLTRDDKEQT